MLDVVRNAFNAYKRIPAGSRVSAQYPTEGAQIPDKYPLVC